MKLPCGVQRENTSFSMLMSSSKSCGITTALVVLMKHPRNLDSALFEDPPGYHYYCCIMAPVPCNNGLFSLLRDEEGQENLFHK